MNIRLLKKSNRLRKSVASFITDEEAPTAIEYAIIASLIGAVIVIGVTAVGVKVLGFFESFVAEFPP